MVNSDSAPANGKPRWTLRLLGRFDLQEIAGGTKLVMAGKRERALLAYLALSPGGRQHRRKLAAYLWGDANDQTLLDNLRTCVWRLRKALGDDAHRLLASDDEEIVLDLAAFDTDVLAFRRLAAETGRAELEKAAGLLNGDILDGLQLDSEEFESWRRLEASRHLDQAVDVLSRLMRFYAEAGDTERAIDAGMKILSLDPLHEAIARQMMQLYAGSGRRGAALQLYHTQAQALRQEVNTQPEAATRQVFAAIAHAGMEMVAPAEALVETPVETSIPLALPPGAARDPLEVPPPHSRLVKWRLSLAALAATLVAGAVLAPHWPAAPTPAAPVPRPAAIAAAPQAAQVTVAVLAFDNLSGDAALQPFSDGIGDEISSSLGKIPGLRLVPPGSAFPVKRETATRDLGVTPNARYLVKGTVRLAQNHMQVTAQLIRTDSGASIWNEKYDRALTDISTVRTDIAMAIAGGLKAPLGLGTQTGSDPSLDAKSGEQFQRVKALMRARFTGVKEAIDILEPLVKRNPGYAPAWAALAQCYAWMPGFLSPYEAAERRRRIQIFFPMALEAAHRAMALDPKLADPYVTLSHIEAFNGRWAAALDFLARALALNPDSSDVLDAQMTIYANVGDSKKALGLAQRIRALEPDAVGWNQDSAEVLWENGQAEPAIAVLESLIDRPSGPTSLAMMYASVGRYKDAAGVLEKALKGPGTLPEPWPDQFRIAAALLRKAPSKAAFPSGLPHLDRVGFVYLYAGAPEHAFDNYEDWIKSGQTGGQGDSFSYIWNASYSPARKTRNFKQFARDAGFVAYWRQRGWPDLCRPTGADDFICE